MKQLLLAIALCFSAVANANIIQISTDSVEVNPGDIVSYKIELIDFEAFDFLTFSLNFDDALVSYDAGSALPGGTIAESMFGSDLFIDDFFSGVLSFTLDGAFSGAVYQSSFVLATFDFVANASGTALFNGEFAAFDSIALGQSQIDNLPTIRTAPAAPVSAPWTFGLMLVGFAGLAIHRKQ